LLRLSQCLWPLRLRWLRGPLGRNSNQRCWSFQRSVSNGLFCSLPSAEIAQSVWRVLSEQNSRATASKFTTRKRTRPRRKALLVVKGYDSASSAEQPRYRDCAVQCKTPEPQLANSPHVNELVRDGKLYLSLKDTIQLALQNNLDIAIARYNLPIADMDILRTKAGGVFRGVNAGVVQGTPGGGVGG